MQAIFLTIQPRADWDKMSGNRRDANQANVLLLNMTAWLLNVIKPCLELPHKTKLGLECFFNVRTTNNLHQSLALTCWAGLERAVLEENKFIGMEYKL